MTKLNENISAQVYQEQQLYPNVKSMKTDPFRKDEVVQYNEFIPIINVVTEHCNETIDIKEKLDGIVIDELTESKEVKEIKEFKQCNETYNNKERDTEKDTFESKKIKNIDDNNVRIYFISFYFVFFLVIVRVN